MLPFRERAINFIYRVATTHHRYKLLITMGGASIFLSIVALFFLLSFCFDRVFHFPRLLPLLFHLYLFLPIFVIGLLLWLWSIRHFMKVKGTPVPFNPPQGLVKTGPYRYCRNPMLTGVFVVMFSLAILCQSISLFFIFTPLFILLNVVFVKKIEEAELEKRLGEAYLEYKKRVPMFFPRF